MNTTKNFSITNKHGIKYATESSDINKIHINSNYGYNSIFGETICHGTLVILNFFKKIKFNHKNNFYIDVIFKLPFFYNDTIFIKKEIHKKYFKYYLIQNKKIKTIIKLSLLKDSFDKIQKIKSKKNHFFKKIPYKNNEIKAVLNTLSMYVGTIYPGENSLISKIKIFHKNEKDEKIQKKNIINIYSKILNKKYPIINNYLKFNSYDVNFETLIRPNIKKKKKITPKYIKTIIDKINHNVLIIGGSQGIGRYFFDILKSNKRIIKIVTYNKNILKYKSKKVIIKKLDVLKKKNSIEKLINQYAPLKIYYFPTKKIYFDNSLSKDIINDYKKIYIDIPLDILRKNKDKKITFFYPSTTNIETNKKSVYSKIKLSAEKKIKLMCNKLKIKYNIYRFPAIHSKQSISLLNSHLPSLIDHINMNKKIIKILF